MDEPRTDKKTKEPEPISQQTQQGPYRDYVEATVIKQNEFLKQKQAAYHQEIGKPGLQRTQEAADRMFTDGKHKYRVSIPKDKAQPEVIIRANSPDEAVGRYNRLCGIRQSDHPHFHELLAA